MLRTAQLIRAGLGSEALHIDMQGWDTHDSQNYHLPRLMHELATALAAFYSDMNTRMQNVTVLVMSEFGRRVAQNANKGTDHGYGGCFMALGGAVNGGRVYGQWPGLAESDRVDGDLAITTDYRQLLWDFLRHRHGASDPSLPFPGFTPSADSGLFRTA